MNGRQIDRMASPRVLAVRGWWGVRFVDELHKLPVGRVCVVNCCKLYGRTAGHHWLAVYRPSTTNLHMFDSAGVRPTRLRNLRVPAGCRSIEYSPVRLQAPYSVTCGLYAVYFCALRANEHGRRQRKRHLRRRPECAREPGQSKPRPRGSPTGKLNKVPTTCRDAVWCSAYSAARKTWRCSWRWIARRFSLTDLTANDERIIEWAEQWLR